MSADLEQVKSHKQFGGHSRFFKHFSKVCQSEMTFAVYLPASAEKKKLPVLYWLSGLTCTEKDFMTEAQAQVHAKNFDVILVVPDVSPRKTGIPGEDDSWDLGSGAGFYVDATQPKWAKHYQMYSYITQEFRELVEDHFPIDPVKRGIFGHSMGGHGALAIGLRNPGLYRSISAFAPICHPSKAPWGIKAFGEYLGPDKSKWAEYDALELIRHTPSSAVKPPILIDQGTEDEFLPDQLFPDEFAQVCREVNYPATVRKQAGYDHSYYFISTFVEEHIAFHKKQFDKA